MKNLVQFYREKHKLLQEDFAKKVKISRQSLSAIETFESIPKGDTMLRISKLISELEGKEICADDIFLLKK